MTTIEQVEFVSILTADEAVKEFRAHHGGRLAGWERMMSRAQYTIDPRKPMPDALDQERMRLKDRAIATIKSCLNAGLVSSQDAKETWGWGYLVDAAVNTKE